MTEQTDRRIRLLVADIDGCLSAGSITNFSPKLMKRLQEVNLLSRSDLDYPAVTVCTGRPQPYVECLLQVTHGYMPALCEGGSIFYDPTDHRVSMHPAFGMREQRLLAKLREAVSDEIITDGIMYEPGKVTHITMLFTPPLKPLDFMEQAAVIAARFGEEFEVDHTRICITSCFATCTRARVWNGWCSTRASLPRRWQALAMRDLMCPS